jgi:uncharacterized membrane protein YkoI
MKGKTVWIMILLAMLLAGSMAWAGDHERARALLEQGKILSLSEIMKQASSEVPGKILEVELEEKHGLIVYEIEFLSEQGVVMEMIIDARTGRMISVKED